MNNKRHTSNHTCARYWRSSGPKFQNWGRFGPPVQIQKTMVILTEITDFNKTVLFIHVESDLSTSLEVPVIEQKIMLSISLGKFPKAVPVLGCTSATERYAPCEFSPDTVCGLKPVGSHNNQTWPYVQFFFLSPAQITYHNKTKNTTPWQCSWLIKFEVPETKCIKN